MLAGAGERAEWYTLAVATPILFVVGDAVPKSVFRRLRESIVYRLSWFLRVSDVLFHVTGLAPLVRGVSAGLMWLLGASRRRRPYHHLGLAAVLAEGHASGALTHFQSVMADRVMQIGDVRLTDVMMPMRHVVRAQQDATVRQIVELIRDHSYSRLPLLDADGQVAGVLDVYEVLTADKSVVPAELAGRPLILSADTTVTDALYQMRQARRALAVVEDAGKHVGIVTIKDLVEEIVGELEAW